MSEREQVADLVYDLLTAATHGMAHYKREMVPRLTDLIVELLYRNAPEEPAS